MVIELMNFFFVGFNISCQFTLRSVYIGPRLGNPGDNAPNKGKSAPGTPFSPLTAAPGTPLPVTPSLPPGADIRDVMAIHGVDAVADGSLLVPTPPFGIKYKTELCLNWVRLLCFFV